MEHTRRVKARAVRSPHPNANKAHSSRPPNPEVEAKAKRRRYSATYKARILEEVDGCTEPGGVAALLRREGLYSSHLASWRKQRRAGTLRALGTKRGRKGKSAAELEVEKLRKENARLKRKLSKADAIIDAQKKIAEILGVDLPKIIDNGESDS
jgi:transposase-like protein